MNISIDKGISEQFVKANINTILEKQFKKQAPLNIHLFVYSHYLGLHMARPLPKQEESKKDGSFIIKGTTIVCYLYAGNIFFYHTVTEHSNQFTYTITGQEQENTHSKPTPINQNKN